MIKALVLDYGNVISQSGIETSIAVMEKETGIPASVFKAVYSSRREGFDRGTVSGEDMYRCLLHDAGYDRQAKDTVLLKRLVHIDLAHWRALDETVCDWALAVRREGFKLGILSNMPTQFLDLYEKEIPPFCAADYCCFSCRVKLVKPEPKIYLNCLEGLGVTAAEAVFFDDIEENITAAKRVGFHAFVWKGLEQGKRDWASCLAETH